MVDLGLCYFWPVVMYLVGDSFAKTAEQGGGCFGTRGVFAMLGAISGAGVVPGCHLLKGSACCCEIITNWGIGSDDMNYTPYLSA